MKNMNKFFWLDAKQIQVNPKAQEKQTKNNKAYKM
jgi:hypothetical protein